MKHSKRTHHQTSNDAHSTRRKHRRINPKTSRHSSNQVHQSRAANRPSSSSDPFHTGGRVTIYGRNPVSEALQDPTLTPQRLFVSTKASGESIKAILKLANEIALPIERLSPIQLSRISKNGKQDQGVALDLAAPLHRKLQDIISEQKHVTTCEPIFLLDGLTTPSNVGMTIRSLCAAGVAGIILPHRGSAPLNPLAIKASAGVALKAPIWTCTTAENAAQQFYREGIPLYGLSGRGERTLYAPPQDGWPYPAVWVLGNESVGVSEDVSSYISDWVNLPMSSQVESLNAAVAASVVAFELRRQRTLNLPSI